MVSQYPKTGYPKFGYMVMIMTDPWTKERVLLRQELRRLRLESGLTQADLADRLSKPQSYVSKLESGDRSLDVIEVRQLCLACGVGFERLIRRFEKILAATL